MAATFYSQADQDIYASGNKFIPQEQYRLGPYTPPAIMGQNTNTGLASTNVAQPYKWPYPEGGGEGAGNISGTQQRSWSPNQNLGPTNITDYEAEAAGVGSTWGGSLAKLQDAFSNLPLPSNLLRKGIRRWREKRDVRRAEEQAVQDARAEAATQHTYAGRDPSLNQGEGGAYSGQGDTPGSSAFRGSDEIATDAASYDLAQGGRVGLYAGGDPEEPSEDVYELMRDQGVPFGERVEDEITEEQKAMVLDMLEKGMDMETIISITGVGQEDVMSLMQGITMAPDPEDQGLASLV